MDAGVGDRLADPDELRILRDAPQGGPDGRFRGAVEIPELAAHFHEPGGEWKIERLAAEDSFIPLGDAANLVLVGEDDIVAGALRLLRLPVAEGAGRYYPQLVQDLAEAGDGKLRQPLAAAGALFAYGAYGFDLATGDKDRYFILIGEPVLWIYWAILEAYDLAAKRRGAVLPIAPLNLTGFLFAMAAVWPRESGW